MQICKKESNTNVYVITDIDKLSSRKLFKLRVFLSSIERGTVKELKDSVEISLEQSGLKQLDALCSFLSELEGENFSVSDAVLNQLSQLKQVQIQKSVTISTILNAKTDEQYDSIEFTTFKAFCDANLSIKLREYQYKAAYLLCLGKGGFDFSVPGAGKTIITYVAYEYLKKLKIVDRILIIGPLSSYNAWIDEYQTCFGKEPNFISLASEDKLFCKDYLRATIKYHHKISFINYEKLRLLSEDIKAFLLVANTLLVFDEAHKIKTPDAKATQAAFSFAPYATVRILLTGTPMPNGYEDLFSLTHILDPVDNILPYGYIKLKKLSKKGASQTELQRIRDSISPYYSRISKKFLVDSGELTTPSIHTIQTSMADDQLYLYNRLDSFCHKINDDIDEDLLLALKKAALIRKMQISANPMLLKKPISESMEELYLLDDSQNGTILSLADEMVMKFFSKSSITSIVNKYVSGKEIPRKNRKAIELTVNLVEQGKKVLIWDIFIQNMNILFSQAIAVFPGQVELINGTVSLIERQAAIKRFREGNSKVLIANPATLAESISLHRACQTAIYVNRNFNCGQYMQSKDRIHRINMPKGTTATYYFIMNQDCIDEAINERLETKEQRMLSILDSNDLVIGGAEINESDIMSMEDIENCFRK